MTNTNLHPRGPPYSRLRIRYKMLDIPESSSASATAITTSTACRENIKAVPDGIILDDLQPRFEPIPQYRLTQKSQRRQREQCGRKADDGEAGQLQIRRGQREIYDMEAGAA